MNQMSDLDLHELVRKIRSGSAEIKPSEIDSVCTIAMQVMSKEPNIVRVQSPLSICGDVHGDFLNLLEIFDIYGDPPHGRYLFLGDYVDRGDKSVDTIMLLLCYKILYPNDVILIRGNHESPHPTITFGFYNEVMSKYHDFVVWQSFIEVFCSIPVAALVDGNIFCVHGGLSPSFNLISQLEPLNRFIIVPNSGILLDILWSDPFSGTGFQTSPRQAGYRWGIDISTKFTHLNKVDLIARGHEKKCGGYEFNHDDQVITVFSSPNYVGEYNEGAALEVISPNEREVTRFRPAQWEKSFTKMIFNDRWY